MAAPLNDCGCCEGITPSFRAAVSIGPGLPQVRYRVGTHGEFLASALAALSDPQFAALRADDRDPDDFTIALLDAWAAVADVLTFYQERIANESYSADRDRARIDPGPRAAHRLSLRPGVAARRRSLSHSMKRRARRQVTVEVGTKVQSVPGRRTAANLRDDRRDRRAPRMERSSNRSSPRRR